MKPLALTADLSLQTHRGIKTETRRPVRIEHDPEPGYTWAECLCREIDPSDTPCEICGARFGAPPLGSPGDLLWLREPARCIGYTPGRRMIIEYAADGAQAGVWHPERLRPVEIGKGLPNGIHREAARWWGRVVEVRVERLIGITEESARAEGCEPHDGSVCVGHTCRASFRVLWDAIYSRRGLGWAANPWVWVTRFERVARPDDWTDTPKETR